MKNRFYLFMNEKFKIDIVKHFHNVFSDNHSNINNIYKRFCQYYF